MGTMHHHTIVVTSLFEDKIKLAHRAAERRFPWVSPLSPEVVNGYRSFFIPPDGSKEGWTASDKGDSRRQGFIDWMNAQAYDDGASGLSWVEVGFGEYGYEVDQNDHDYYLEEQARQAQAEADAEALALAGTSPSDAPEPLCRPWEFGEGRKS